MHGVFLYASMFFVRRTVGGHALHLLAGSGVTRGKLHKRTQKNSSLGLVGPLDSIIFKKKRVLWKPGFSVKSHCEFFCGKRTRQNPKEVVNNRLNSKRTAIGAFGSPKFAL